MNFFTGLYLFLFFFGIFFITIFLILHWRHRKDLFYSPEAKTFPSVSFLVPAYNEEKSLKETVEALMEIDYPKNKKEILIINDGSTDGTLKIAKDLEKKYSIVKVINKKNSGKANSLNHAIRFAKGELIAVVDADSYPKKDSLKKMVGYFEDEKVAAVTSRVLVKNKKKWIERYQVLDYSIIAWTRKLLDFVDSVYVTNGPLSVYRKREVIKVGGFDPTNLTEDIEITWHLLSEGYKTRMAYNAIVYTTVPDNFSQWTKQRVRWNLGGMQTIRKYRKAMFHNPENAFGYFVVPYVSASFAFAIIGIFLVLRYIWIKGAYNLASFYYAFFGYDYLKYIGFDMYVTLLLLMAGLFFTLSIIYYKTGFKNSETGKKSVLKILIYSVTYRSLYTIPLVIALYKLARGDTRWYTK